MDLILGSTPRFRVLSKNKASLGLWYLLVAIQMLLDDELTVILQGLPKWLNVNDATYLQVGPKRLTSTPKASIIPFLLRIGL